LKRILVPTVLLFLSIGFAGNVFAKGKSTDVEIYQASQIAGAMLQPGSYTVVVNTTGSTADVTFKQNGKQVATMPGQIVRLAKKSDSTSVTLDNSGGVPTIAAIDFEGSQMEVSFSAAANSTNSGE
jgi:hypothetical protein